MKIDIMGVMVETRRRGHSRHPVVSPEDRVGVEVSLEPDKHPAARTFNQALVADRMSFTSFAAEKA